VQLVVAERGIVFQLDEIRQHIVKTPAGIAEVAPAIVVLRLAAHDDEAVDRA